ncbi:hypothetical protein B0H65DRAFT_323178 [Neurospora tetraspora]|uniref:Uncharacterized protein n=1 Tax=Neurospora tetraspora TaxID=94610 RepID=A0AAE0MPA8_9PEZI|nr:hypothetical protein B0H65DRAFT_323178 [Neurospora tetraspora]
MGWSSACPFHPIPGSRGGTPPPWGPYCGGVWLIKLTVAQPNMPARPIQLDYCLCSISSSSPFLVIGLLLAIRLEANNSVDHFQPDPSSSVLFFFNSKP